MAVTLHGYRYSVYLRIARMTMLEKGVAWSHVEVNPFSDPVSTDYLALNPFGRVPTLDHDGFVLYETTAITRYVDESFDGPSLQPEAPRERARMNQIIAIADCYGYWPMVRQVFSERVFNAARRTPDEAVIAEGLMRSRKVLAAMEPLAGGSGFLVGGRLTLADLHLGAMVAYFTAADEGAEALGDYPKLGAWWAVFKNRKSLAETDPGLPDN
jgi:glutathione S-transferase